MTVNQVVEFIRFYRRPLWAATTALMFGCVTYLMLFHQGGGSMPKFPHADKLYHAIAFSALLFPTAALRPRWIWKVAVASLAYGAFIEVVQPQFGRQAEWADLLADAIGVVIGALLGLGFRRAFTAMRAR